jgi:hypothetical protein
MFCYAAGVKWRPLNSHVALSVAAGLAHRQLAAQPAKFYDVEHYSEVMNLVAQALLRVAQVYVADASGGERRGLSEADLINARVRRGATLLMLADGRSFRHLWLLREDLRNGIAILASSGVHAFAPPRAPK